MKCNSCGFEAPEGCVFCPQCGNSLTAEQTQTQAPVAEETAAPAVEETAAPAAEQRYCLKCGQPRIEGTDYCVYCGGGYGDNAKRTSPPYTTPSAPTPMYSGKAYRPKRKVGLVLGIIAAVLAVIVLVGVLTNWFGFYGPVTKTVLGAQKTLLKKGSFTMEYQLEDGDEVTMYVELNPDKRHLQVYAEVDDAEMAIYDGYYIERYEYDGQSYYHCMDISDQLDEVFDKYEETKGKKFDIEELLESIDEDLYEEAEEYIEFDEVKKCVIKCFRKLNSNSWLKENAGFKKSSSNGVTYYKFDVDMYSSAKDLLKTMKPIFKDDDDYDMIEDGLKESKSYLRDMEIEAKVGLKWGKLVSVEVDAMDVAFEVKFTDIGKTSINDSDMEDFLSEALEQTNQSR